MSQRASRRIWIGALLLAAAGIAGWLALTPRQGFPPITPARDQNILLVTIDTLRADALGSYGGRARTPQLDRLAAEGVRYSFAHAHAVMTLPSHASILTGRYPFEHGVRDNSGFRLDDSATTLAELARARGMAAGAFVAAFPLDRQFGLTQGFDVYDDGGARTAAPSDFALAQRAAPEVVASATDWIRRQTGPWLAWVHVFEPHSPYAPPPPYRAEYANDLYAGEVAYTDAALAPLFDLVRGAPRATLVVVTADHGEGLGEHGEATHGVFAYESTLRVPLIVAQLRGQAAAGASGRAGYVSDTPVQHVDILPTIASLAELAAPPGLPGRSLVPAPSGDGADRASYFEAMSPMLKRGWAPLAGVIDGRQKYIELPLPELYDLAADPREQQNLTAQSAERARVLAARLKQFSAALPGTAAPESAESAARLRSLGYVSGSSPRKAHYTDADDPKRLIDLDRVLMDAIAAHHAGRAGEAIASFQSLVDRRPDMELGYRHLAYAQWDSGRQADAIATLRRSIARNGSSLETDVRLATYLAESGETAEAVTLLERVSRAAPGNTEALNALGIAHARAGRRADALRTFERILAADPRDAQAHENIGTLQLGADMRAAAAAFTRALEIAPGSSRAHAGLGVVALFEGRRDEAIVRMRRAVELDPRNFDALFNLATELINAGRLAEARPFVERFVRTAPRGVYGKDIERLRAVLR